MEKMNEMIELFEKSMTMGDASTSSYIINNFYKYFINNSNRIIDFNKSIKMFNELITIALRYQSEVIIQELINNYSVMTMEIVRNYNNHSSWTEHYWDFFMCLKKIPEKYISLESKIEISIESSFNVLKMKEKNAKYYLSRILVFFALCINIEKAFYENKELVGNIVINEIFSNFWIFTQLYNSKEIVEKYFEELIKFQIYLSKEQRNMEYYLAMRLMSKGKIFEYEEFSEQFIVFVEMVLQDVEVEPDIKDIILWLKSAKNIKISRRKIGNTLLFITSYLDFIKKGLNNIKKNNQLVIDSFDKTAIINELKSISSNFTGTELDDKVSEIKSLMT